MNHLPYDLIDRMLKKLLFILPMLVLCCTPVVFSQNREVNNKNTAFASFYAKSWAVIIGINNYKHWPTLQYAVSDAQAMKKKLEAIGFEKIILLNNNQATRKNILKVLGEELKEKVGKEDRVIIYFSGHGQTETLPGGGEVGYIIPVDCGMSSWFSEGISMDQLRSLHERIRAKHILYIVDACFSGLGLVRAGGIDPTLEGFYGKLTRKRAVQIISAGGKNEVVHERNGHGILTNYILEGLDGEADHDFDGLITGSELGSYVRRRVSTKTQNKQTPQWGALDGEGDVLFVINKEKAKEVFRSITQFDPSHNQKVQLAKKEESLRAIETDLQRKQGDLQEMMLLEKELAFKKKQLELKCQEKDDPNGKENAESASYSGSKGRALQALQAEKWVECEYLYTVKKGLGIFQLTDLVIGSNLGGKAKIRFLNDTIEFVSLTSNNLVSMIPGNIKNSNLIPYKSIKQIKKVLKKGVYSNPFALPKAGIEIDVDNGWYLSIFNFEKKNRNWWYEKIKKVVGQ